MVYEFHELERHSINKLITRLTLDNIEYIQFNTEETNVFVTNPNTKQKISIKIYKYLDILLFTLIFLLLYSAMKTTNLTHIIMIVISYICIGMFYKISDKCFVKWLKMIN